MLSTTGLVNFRNQNSTAGYQGDYAEKEAIGSTNSFELRLYDARIGRWMTTDPEGQYHSPYLGMGNNPINGVDPDGGYVYIIGGSIGDYLYDILAILGTEIGKETLKYIINSKHFHIHIGDSDGNFGGSKKDSHGAYTIGGLDGFYAKKDGLYLTVNDIKSKNYKKYVYEKGYPFIRGAKKDKGHNWYIGVNIYESTKSGQTMDLFHEIRSHVYTAIFQGIDDKEMEHMIFSGNKRGKVDLIGFPSFIWPDNPAYNFMSQLKWSLPENNYKLGNPDENGNRKVFLSPRDF